MSCGCKIKKEMSELERVSELARKAAMLDECNLCHLLES